MTPEDRAAKVLQVYRHETGGVPFDPVYLGRAIAAAIRAAEQEARNVLLAEIQAAATKSHQQASEWNNDHPFIAGVSV